MKTVTTEFDGVSLVTLEIDGEPMVMPYPDLESFGSYCGAGKGLTEWIVPETIHGKKVRISAACWIHDQMFKFAEPTWADFHQANSIFFHNILAIIDATVPVDVHDKDDRLKHARYYRAVTYYMAVDTGIGAYCFWKDRGGVPA